MVTALRLWGKKFQRQGEKNQQREVSLTNLVTLSFTEQQKYKTIRSIGNNELHLKVSWQLLIVFCHKQK